MLLTCSAAYGSVLYVDDDAPPAGNGQTWETACRFLQDALALAAASGGGVSEIHVAQGTYTPDRDEANPGGPSDCCVPHGGLGCDDASCEALVCAASPFCCAVEWDATCAAIALDLCGDLCTASREATFQLLNGVAVMGGYAGLSDPDNPDHRDIVFHETILSGDLLGDDDTGGSNAENSYTVVTGSDTDATAELDGFTITAGNADGPGDGELQWRSGAGMWSDTGGPTITNCTFALNVAAFSGGGMYNYFSTPTITDCTFLDNTASGNTGGGIVNHASAATMLGCTFSGNAALAGGGMNNYQCNPTVTDCTFTGNVADPGSGGGMYNNDSSPTVTDCAFSANTAGHGGAMSNDSGSSPTVTNCTFSGNTAGTNGGAMFNYIDSNPTVSNCTFSGNAAPSGGAMCNASSSPQLSECNFLGNTADAGGGAIYNFGGSPTVNRCTLSGNTAILGGGMDNAEVIDLHIAECTFMDNTAEYSGGGMYNIDSSPTVVSCTFTGNRHLDDFGGGGGMINTRSQATVTNCIFAENEGVQGAAMANADAGDPTLANCTFVGNVASSAGGGLWNGINSHPTADNCIFWANVGGEIHNNVDCSATVSYSDVQGGYPGAGNIDEDPLFADPVNDDYHLSAGSLCIDAANNAAVPIDVTTDLDGNPRFVDDPDSLDCWQDPGNCGHPPIVDMGAYEYRPPSCPCDCEATPDGTVDVGDFLALLAQWGGPGPCDCEDPPDGTVDVGDFLALLATWGPCP